MSGRRAGAVLLGIASMGGAALALATPAADEGAEVRTTQARAASAPAVPELGCDDVRGGPRIERINRRWDIVVGKLAFVGLRQASSEPRAAFRRRGGRDAIWKAPVALPAGERAVVRISAADADEASLSFAEPSYGTPRVEDGVRAIAFVACDDGELSAWPGGFVVKRAMCVAVEVTGPGRPRRVVRVGFGKRRCPRGDAH